MAYISQYEYYDNNGNNPQDANEWLLTDAGVELLLVVLVVLVLLLVVVVVPFEFRQWVKLID